tara:strand:+ start:1108 stop:1809 length:702 start_codon:yes stop_codon:yes gene_type:complete
MHTVMFDLDGTLTDSREGLLLCLEESLIGIGCSVDTRDELEPFLGSPLPVVFRTVKPTVTETEIESGIAAFRKVYETEGIYHNRLYPGVVDMLRSMALNGHESWVVTSKPQVYAEIVCTNLGIDRHLRGVVGANLDETDTKTTLINSVLTRSNTAPEEALMLGDRHYDVIGAIENAVRPVGALWGYGDREELSAAGCQEFVSSAKEFERLVSQNFFPSDRNGKQTVYNLAVNG